MSNEDADLEDGATDREQKLDHNNVAATLQNFTASDEDQSDNK